MRLDLDAEDRAFAASIAAALAAGDWPAQARDALDHPPQAIGDEQWTQAVELGWLASGVPADGGSVVAASIVCEQLARHLAAPALGLAVAATAVVAAAWPELTLAKQSGERQLRLAIALDAAPTASLDDRGRVRLDRPVLVADGADADVLVLAAHRGDEEFVVAVDRTSPGITLTPQVRLDGAPVHTLAVDGAAAVHSEGDIRGQAVGHALLASSLLGLLERVLADSVAYTTTREQFGRPVATYQAVSHRLADMLCHREMGRSLLYGSLARLATDDSDGPRMAHAVKAYLSERSVEAAETSIQLHGGIGYTWEHHVHLALRQAICLGASGGTAAAHWAALGSELFEDPT